MVHFNFTMVGMWNVLHRLLPLTPSPAQLVLSGEAELPWRKWVTGGWALIFNNLTLFPVPSLLAAKMEAGRCHMVPLTQSPLPFLPTMMDCAFKTQVQTNSPSLGLLPVRCLGSAMRKATKTNFSCWTCVSIYHKYYTKFRFQYCGHPLFPRGSEVLWEALFVPLPHPQADPYPCFALFSVAHRWMTLHGFFNCRLWHDINPEH